jgi:CheY-like chemotaxis protein
MQEYLDCVIRAADEYSPKPFYPWTEESDSTQSEPAKRRVLVVDDERLVADTTAEILCGAGFDAKSAYDGWAALEIIRSFHPDVVLTDVMMPQMNGVELAMAVAKTLPSTKVVLFSGQAGISVVLEQGRNQGYEFPLIAKPIHPLKLIETLRQRDLASE